ncbi:MAG: Asp-tRNA(Asn)/Glu-tRNA(Gln) amidotransferase subunit GatB, partial [Cytophagales bacterium]|nr:Asp-tRNA(Asn)/Glu-tRNA(Gln) amidotransferase subunit GatB [Cytophagales bacterium]
MASASGALFMKKDISDTYEVIIGLEVHAQLLTASKIYSSESAAYGNPPNTAVGVISLGHPGTLPRLNKRVVELAVKMGLACHADIARDQIFDRKNYFYPDLPKGYQITQDQTPLCRNGFVRIRSEGSWKNIHLTKIHIEEDAGKSLHGESETLLDFNRAGVPLIEIVTNPEIRSAAEATAFVSEVRKLVRYLGICDGNMEEGSLRCDANVSVRLCGVSKLGKKVEIKNLNSIRSLGRAIAYETTRQSKLLQEGKAV